MYKKTLFEVLRTKEIKDQNNYLAGMDNEEYILSIKDHLECMLNVRQGSLAHVPDYGLPDIISLFQGLPDSKKQFVHSIKASIDKYEKRLKHVQVRQISSNQYDCVVCLSVTGEIEVGDKVSFDTLFLSGGEARVEKHERLF